MDTCTIKFRADQLQAMHDVIRCANDEEIYFTWIELIPDEPRRDDFESVAESDEEYNEIVDLFIKLVSKKGYRG